MRRDEIHAAEHFRALHSGLQNRLVLLVVAMDATAQRSAKGEVGRTERKSGRYCHRMMHLMVEVVKTHSEQRFGAAVVLEPELCSSDHWL